MQTDNARHGTLVALWAIYGLICIVKAAWIVVYWGTLTVMWGALLNRVANPLFWMNAFHTWLTGAVILLIVGMNASHSAADQISNTFTGRFTHDTAVYIFGGGAAALGGLLMVVFGVRGESV